MLVCGGREAVVMAPSLCVTQQYSLAFLALRLSSKGISHHNILPHIPSTSFCSQQQPSSGDYSTVPKLQLPATTLSGGVYGCCKDYLILIPFRNATNLLFCAKP